MIDLPITPPRAAIPVEEEAALVRAAQREPEAFAVLYRRYVGPIYRYLYSRVGTVPDAEDLTTQVFTAALEGLENYREQGNFSAWLFAIARYKVMDHYRRRDISLPLDEALDGGSGEGDPLRQVVRDEALRRLTALVAGLEEEKQELLRLRFAGELTYQEIGELVGRSEAAVKMAIHRLLRQLEAAWEEDDA